jgi:lipopolysaccharide transport system ATP-binding protein
LLTRSGTGEARVSSLQLLDRDGNALAVAQVGQAVELRLTATIHADQPRLVLGYMIRDKQGHVAWGTNTWHTKQVQDNLRRGETVEFRLPFTCTLGPGSYSVSPALVSTDTHLVDNYEWVDNLLVFDVLNIDRDFFIGSTSLDAQFSIARTAIAEADQ